MCTAITLKSTNGNSFFGRNMDFSHDIAPHIYSVPANYIWKSIIDNKKIETKYMFMGIGQVLGDISALFDGVNEKGLAGGALYFAGYAKYSKYATSSNKIQLASFDFLKYILSSCATITDVMQSIKNINIIGAIDPVTKTAAPLHWIFAEKNGKSIVIEPTEKGIEIFDNTIGVLANSPDFKWHMTNLNNYINVASTQQESTIWGNVTLTQPSQAGGTIALPSGYASPARFARTAFIKTHIQTPTDINSTVTTCFNSLQSVTIPKGLIITARGTSDYTQYTAFIDQEECTYYFNTHTNLQIYKITLNSYKDSTTIQDLGSIVLPIVFQDMNPTNFR